MIKKVLILGDHPLHQNLSRQYVARGYAVDSRMEAVSLRTFMTSNVSINDYDEMCLLTCILPSETHDADRSSADQEALELLRSFAVGYDKEQHEGRRLLCHLLLQSQVTLWLLQTLDLYQDICTHVELCPFTMEDQWAKNVFCYQSRSTKVYRPLDWHPITAASSQKVHLFIHGFNAMAESLAKHAALTAHFPNYIRNHGLRTRITIVDRDIVRHRDSFIARYQDLFNHSYYRFIELGESRKQTLFHQPQYSSEREEFVDVEWEFVEGSLQDVAMQAKLDLWASDPGQLLTIALCSARPDANIEDLLTLPSAIRQHDIPVLIYTRQSGILDEMRAQEDYQNLFPIGMDDCGYDIGLPLLQMAKRLHYFYICSYGQKGTPTDMPLKEVEEEWAKISTYNIRYSNMNNVMTIATKMRSLGHDENDWEHFYALTQDEVELLSAVEHNRWSVDRLMTGFRPPNKEEREAIGANIREIVAANEKGGNVPEKYLKNEYKRKKVHYDLCAYNELGEDRTGQNVKVYDYDLTASIPLIANSFKKSQHQIPKPLIP